MKKLTKEQQAERDELIDEFAERKAALEEQAGNVQHEVDKYDEHVNALNDTIGKINEFAANVAQDIEHYMEERSDKWLESERAAAYSDWKEQWLSVELSEVEQMKDVDVGTPDLDEFEQAASAVDDA